MRYENMKLRSLLNEIGNRILYPQMQVGWGGGRAYFTIDGIDYEIKIKLGFDFDVEPGIVKFVDISFAFNVKGKEDYNLTNQNVPLKVMNYVIGALDKLPEQLFKGSKDTNEIRINSIVYSTPDERKSNIYSKIIDSYSKNKGASAIIKKVASDGTYRATFEPYLKFIRK